MGAELSKSIEYLLECSHRKSKKTFKTLITDAGMNPDFYLFDQLDTNKDGKITLKEFEANFFSELPKVVGNTPFADESLLEEVKEEEREEPKVTSYKYCGIFC